MHCPDLLPGYPVLDGLYGNGLNDAFVVKGNKFVAFEMVVSDR